GAELTGLLRTNRLDRLRKRRAVVVAGNDDGDSVGRGVSRTAGVPHQRRRTDRTAAGSDRSRRIAGRANAAEVTANPPRALRANATGTSPGSAVASRDLYDSPPRRSRYSWIPSSKAARITCISSTKP